MTDAAGGGGRRGGATALAWATGDAARDGEGGALERPVPQSAWTVPLELRLDANGAALEWPWVGARRGATRLVQPGAGLLEAFVRLSERGPEQFPGAVLAYARRWGVLELCAHGLAASHNPPRQGLSERPNADHCTVPLYAPRHAPSDDLSAAFHRQPLAAWRHYATQAAAVLRIAARLHADQPGRPEDWAVLPSRWRAQWRLDAAIFERAGVFPGGGLGQTLARERWALSEAVNEWLRLGDVRPAFGWLAATPALELGSGSLFSALAVQLLLAVQRAEAFALCSHCAAWYPRVARLRAGQRNYCAAPDCQRAKVRHAARDYRQRNREQPDRPRQPRGPGRGRAKLPLG